MHTFFVGFVSKDVKSNSMTFRPEFFIKDRGVFLHH